MLKKTLYLTVAATLGATLAACSTNAETASDTRTSASTSADSAVGSAPVTSSPAGSALLTDASPSPSQDQPNDVDIMFVTMMIPHHEGAVAMAELAPSRASSQQVKDLAAQIQRAQGPEIDQMNSWLAEWGVPSADAEADSGGHAGMDHGSGDSNDSGMSDDLGMGDMMNMSETDMASLEAASGTEFDRMFLEQMIVHHQGAVDMAQMVIDQGSATKVRELAEAIITGQEAEIALMQELLEAP